MRRQKSSFQRLNVSQSLTFRVRNALASLNNPSTGENLLASGAISAISVDADGVARFTIELVGLDREAGLQLLKHAEHLVADLEGISRVSAIATAHKKPSPAPAASGHANPLGISQAASEEKPDALGAVKNVIAIASGKGGVGKSTIAANIAVALARAGLKTGFLDADIYGPSAPTLFGINEKADVVDGVIQPKTVYGVRVMSMGFLVDESQALAWRGPMVMGALGQLMRDVAWGALDVLIVDTPPGTGDAHLSLIRSSRLTGAVIVSTPQQMALADVRRGAALFKKTNTPIVGVIENMAWLEGTDGERQYLFGEGGAKRAADELDVPFLGELPLMPVLREASDAGEPIAASEQPQAKLFSELAEKIVTFTQR